MSLQSIFQIARKYWLASDAFLDDLPTYLINLHVSTFFLSLDQLYRKDTPLVASQQANALPSLKTSSVFLLHGALRVTLASAVRNMSARSSRPFGSGEMDKKHGGTTKVLYEDVAFLSSSSEKEVFSLENIDPPLNAQMHLITSSSFLMASGMARICFSKTMVAMH